jgi:hypothetical protein
MSDANLALHSKRAEALFPPSAIEETERGAGADPADAADTSRLVWLLQRVFSFPAMLATFLLGRVFYEARAFLVDPDLWWHIRTGDVILSTHHWPTVDPYSFTVAGQPWIDCEWIGDLLLASVARVGGVLGLGILLMVLSAVVVMALYGFATLRSGNSKAGFVSAGVLCSLAFASFTLRPQMLGYLFLVLTLIALEKFRRGKQLAIWFLPALFLLWINTHGSWIIGLGAIFVYWSTGLVDWSSGDLETERWTLQERKTISLVFMLCLAVLPLTPYGTMPAAYPFEVASNLPLGVANVSEWQSMPFGLAGGKMFLAFILGFMLLQIIFRFKWKLAEILLFLFGTMMACLHVRFVLIFVPFFAPIFATMLARWLPPYSRKKDLFVLNAVLMVAVVIAVVYYFPSRADLQKRVSEAFPTDTVEYMVQHHIAGPLLNNYAFGGYLIWANQKVFVDGRSDPYERGGALADYLHISHLMPGAFTVLDRYGIQSCLLAPDEPLATALAALPGWQRVASDKVSVLYVRRPTSSTSVAAPKTTKE